MIKDFDKNKVEVMDFGSNGHYLIPLEKDIVIVQVSVPCYEVGDEVCTYLFQILVPKDDTSWKSDYVNSDGVPTEYTREVINQISGTEYDKEVYDKSEVSFTYLEDIPNVRYLDNEKVCSKYNN